MKKFSIYFTLFAIIINFLALVIEDSIVNGVIAIFLLIVLYGNVILYKDDL